MITIIIICIRYVYAYDAVFYRDASAAPESVSTSVALIVRILMLFYTWTSPRLETPRVYIIIIIMILRRKSRRILHGYKNVGNNTVCPGADRPKLVGRRRKKRYYVIVHVYSECSKKKNNNTTHVYNVYICVYEK